MRARVLLSEQYKGLSYELRMRMYIYRRKYEKNFKEFALMN